MIKEWLLKLAFKILDKYKVNYFIYPSEENQNAINALVDQVELKFGVEEGEFKRAQVMRAAMNSLPKMSERDIAFAIELSIRKESRV